MIITEVRVLVHERVRRFTPAATQNTMGVLSIVTDDGLEGHAFVGGARSIPEVGVRNIAQVVRPMLVGRDAGDIGIIWNELWRQERALGSVVIGAVDVALWDLLGKAAGLPVHRLLGTARKRIPAYVSSWVHEHPDDYVAEALHYREQGFGAYKFHPPTQRRMMGGHDVPLEVDIETARAVRDAVGPDMKLMSDSPFVYGFEEALRMGRVLEELDFWWYEDPLPTDDIEGYRRLRSRLSIPFLATEMTGGGPYTYAPWIESGVTDYLRGDVAFKGGITPLVKIARLAELHHLGFELHDGFNAVGNAAGANVVMATPNASFFEVLTIQETGVYGFDNFNYGLVEPLPLHGGELHATTGPGLGVEVDWELIRAGTVAEL